MDQETEIGRLAFREEGAFWVAYFAGPGTMDQAVVLGSIRMNVIQACPEHKAAFVTLMRGVLDTAFAEMFGAVPEWRGAQPAPDHERTKKA